ncbi:hypothetical protein M422DRAFT_31030 [Sphaerobolus stellatus SS14]|uniref:Unplaced genomic scaffold SPHSTscaffold_50, whole genome shotgun sequence n=1 Tax=Sphaerobolus stellatus (strain SS14) TaxID=990650 RepID=A0A0C9VXF5_SPHS4|nr:hypothetical protein M422DRAFT_31030 [Sphaerobolus stellatus SS14]
MKWLISDPKRFKDRVKKEKIKRLSVFICPPGEKLVNILGLVSISQQPEKSPPDSVQDHPGSHRLLATRPTGSSAEG